MILQQNVKRNYWLDVLLKLERHWLGDLSLCTRCALMKHQDLLRLHHNWSFWGFTVWHTKYWNVIAIWSSSIIESFHKLLQITWHNRLLDIFHWLQIIILTDHATKLYWFIITLGMSFNNQRIIHVWLLLLFWLVTSNFHSRDVCLIYLH